MRNLEAAQADALSAPEIHELAVLVEMDDAVIADIRRVTIRDEDVALRRNDHRIGFVKGVLAIALDAGRAQGAQQLAVAVELQDIVADAIADMAVGQPDVIVLVDIHAVRKEKFSRAEGFEEIAIGIELHNGIELGALAVIGAATVGYPDIALVIHRHGAGRTHLAAGWQLQEVIHLGIGIGIGVGIGVRLVQGLGKNRRRRQEQGGAKCT